MGILQKIFAGFKPQLLNEQFAGKSESAILCMTPVLQEYEYYKNRENLSSAVTLKIENILKNSARINDQSIISPSGLFKINYTLSGSYAVSASDTDGNGIPDYVDHVAFAADSSYNHLVKTLGFHDFMRGDPYEIHIHGYSLHEIGGSTFITTDATTTNITISNRLGELLPNSHPMGHEVGAIYAVVAHEIKHATQFAANDFWAEELDDLHWWEMDATLAESIVFKDAFSYRFRLFDSDFSKANMSSIFGDPGFSTPFAYYHVTWLIYFLEQFGVNFFVDVWDEIAKDGKRSFTDVFTSVLEKRPANLDQQLMLNHLWHLSSGEYSLPGFGFSKKEEYPTPNFQHTFTTVPGETGLDFYTLEHFAAHYFTTDFILNSDEQPVIRLSGPQFRVGVGFIALLKDGSVRKKLDYYLPKESTIEAQSGWKWQDIEKLSFVIVNSSQNKNTRIAYRLTLDSMSFSNPHLNSNAIFTLNQNYPNPFNPSTTIVFELYESSRVELKIFDLSGKLIQTLVHQELEPSLYRYVFDASDLSSGTYFYQLTTNQTVTTKKMVLVK